MSSEPGGPDSEGDEPLSSEVLAELRTVGGDELVRELMAVFAERMPERLRSAEQSLAAGDLEGAAAAVHSLRSAAGTIGALALAELAGRVEKAARSDRDGGQLDAALQELRRKAEEALDAANRLTDAAT